MKNYKLNKKTRTIIYIIINFVLIGFAIIIYIFQSNIADIKADYENVTKLCNVRLASNDYKDIEKYRNLAQVTEEICEKYSKEVLKIIKFRYQPSEIKIIVFSYENDKNKSYEYNFSHPMYALNGIIYINFDYLHDKDVLENSDYAGVIFHEIAHVYQNFPPKQNNNSDIGWIAEGMATYVGDKIVANHLFEKLKGNYPICNSGENIKSGYGCTAKFFYFLESKYDHDIVQKINEKIEQSLYSENIFLELTNKNLSELKEEFNQSIWCVSYNNSNRYPYAYITGKMGNDSIDQQYTLWDRCLTNNSLIHYYCENNKAYSVEYKCSNCMNAVCTKPEPKPEPKPTPVPPTPDPVPSPTPPPPIEDPSIKNKDTKTYPKQLAPTGVSLWFNIIIALSLSIILGYIIFKDEIREKIKL